MKLNVSEYRWILLNCNLMVGLYKGKQYAVIEPKFPKYQAKLDRLLGSVNFPSIEEWNKLSRELRPKLKENNKIRRDLALRKLAGADNKKLAALNNKQRIELLDGLLLDVVSRDAEAFNENRQTIISYKDQFKILFFGIELPKEFLDREQARCEQFCHRLQSVPNLKTYLEDWQHLDFKQRNELSRDILQAFNGTYKTNVELRFFSENEWFENRRHKAGAIQATGAPTAYAENNTVFLNKEKIAACDNLAVPALIFHEALHIARRQEDWSQFPLIDKLFESKFAYLALDCPDLSLTNPMEANAYAMDEKVASFLLEKMQIRFIENNRAPELNNVVRDTKDKAAAAFEFFGMRRSEK